MTTKHSDITAAFDKVTKLDKNMNRVMNPTLIVVKNNPRIDYGDIEGLAREIKAYGVIEPLTVAWDNGKFVLVDGHRRMRAIIDHKLKIDAVPVKLEVFENEAERLIHQMIHNEGQEFNEIEKGKVFKTLIANGMTQEQVGTKFNGISRVTVRNALRLLDMSPKVQAAIIAGDIDATRCRNDGFDKLSHADQDRLLSEILEGNEGGEGGEGGEAPARKQGKKAPKSVNVTTVSKAAVLAVYNEALAQNRNSLNSAAIRDGYRAEMAACRKILLGSGWNEKQVDEILSGKAEKEAAEKAAAKQAEKEKREKEAAERKAAKEAADKAKADAKAKIEAAKAELEKAKEAAKAVKPVKEAAKGKAAKK